MVAAHANTKDKNVVIYPNPITDKTINIKSSEQITHVEVINILGSVVIEKKIAKPSTEINLLLDQKLDAGFYLIKTELSGQESKVNKIVVK